MDTLKKFFPLSFQPKPDVASLVVNILLYLLIGVVASWIIGIAVFIPIVNLLVGLAGGLAELYVVGGIVLSCLDYFKILK